MPGTSSKRTWPSHSNATISRSITLSLPTMTRLVFWRMARVASCTWRISSVCVMEVLGLSRDDDSACFGTCIDYTRKTGEMSPSRDDYLNHHGCRGGLLAVL